jgi:hypothetical protein
VAGYRECVAFAAFDADGTRIYAPQVRWSFDSQPQAEIGDHVCFTFDPDAPALTLRARYGDKEEARVVHGRELLVIAIGEPLQ